jgi:hypothetical protein
MDMTDETKMTLRQVRDVLDNRAAHFAKIGEWQAALELRAIDAALKTRGEPVAWMATCMGPIYASEVFRTRKEAEECGDAWDHCHVTPLYTAPPTADRPTWEEVREMIAMGIEKGWIESDPKLECRYKMVADRIIAEFRKETSDKFAAGLTCANRVTAGDT